MSGSPNTLDVDRLLGQAARPSDDDVRLADLAASYAELHTEVAQLGRTLSVRRHLARRRGLRRGVLLSGVAAIAAVLVIGPTGATATGWVSAHTGLFGSPGATENGTGEFLDTGARDFPAVALRLAAGISYPPGDSADTYIARLQSAAHDDEAAGYGATLMEGAGVQDYLRLDAVCAWSGYGWTRTPSVTASGRRGRCRAWRSRRRTWHT